MNALVNAIPIQTRISRCLLKNGKSPTRISPVGESDAEIVIALNDRFGDSVVSAQIGDRSYLFPECLEKMLSVVKRRANFRVLS